MFDSRNDPVMDRFVADLVEGAERNSRANGGPGVNVLVSRNRSGSESKLANHAALGAGLGGLMVPGLGAPIGAALGADEGHRGDAALGSILGGLGGGLGGMGLGGLIGALAGNPGLGAMAGGTLGGAAGTLYGAHKGGESESILDKAKSKLGAAHDDGAKTAVERFGVKEAFLPLLGSLVGGTALRAGAGALARGAGGRMLGGLASKALPHMTGGIGGAATDMIGGMAGGALGQRLMPG